MSEPATAADGPTLLGTVTTLYENLVRHHPIRSPEPPWAIVDDSGREIRFHAADDPDEETVDSLVAMYDAFGPADRAQGTPPIHEPAIREWLDVIQRGHGVVARHGDHPVGQIVFVPDGDRHELAIYVHPDYQRTGIGRTLLRTGLGHAATQGVSTVWLCVESHRRGVERLYRDAGFRVDDPIAADLDPSTRATTHLSREL